MHQLKLTCRLINRYLEIANDAITYNTGGSISITMIFELHALAADN